MQNNADVDQAYYQTQPPQYRTPSSVFNKRSNSNGESIQQNGYIVDSYGRREEIEKVDLWKNTLEKLKRSQKEAQQRNIEETSIEDKNVQITIQRDTSDKKDLQFSINKDEQTGEIIVRVKGE